MNILNSPYAEQNLDAYYNSLKIINGVNFTPREVDIIACLLSGKGAKTIARFLSIEEKTVETHKYNVMRKLERNSKEGIIHFIEQSDKFSALKYHYLSLLREAIFEKYLGQICNLVGGKETACTLIHEKSEGSTYFINQFEKHLRFAGIKVCRRLKESQEPLTYSADFDDANSVVYLAPKSFSEALRIEDSPTKLKVTEFVQKLNQHKIRFIFLLEDAALMNTSYEMPGAEYIICGAEDYYFTVFRALQALLPGVDIEKITLEFKKSYNAIDTTNYFLVDQNSNISEAPSSCELKDDTGKSQNYPITIQNKMVIRSDLVIPTGSTLLKREMLISKIEDAFEGEEGIQAVALVGIGGSGKTTAARLFARHQGWPIVWEINAETRETLICCFENLAYALSQTEDEKRKLRGLQEINNQKDKEDKIILFVKDKLQFHGNWLLIYDNVEKFSDIQKYFPFSTETWGRGKIIITSRDGTIQYNNHIKTTISVTELNVDEKLNLFVNIMNNGDVAQFANEQEKQTASFLNHIPPFPLDVSIAAYY